VVFAIKICSCEFLGFNSSAVEFSVLVSCGTSRDDWSPTFRDNYAASKIRTAITQWRCTTYQNGELKYTDLSEVLQEQTHASTRTHAHTHTYARPVVDSSILDQFNDGK